jgi:hypothetical protein
MPRRPKPRKRAFQRTAAPEEQPKKAAAKKATRKKAESNDGD